MSEAEVLKISLAGAEDKLAQIDRRTRPNHRHHRPRHATFDTLVALVLVTIEKVEPAD